LGLRTKREEKRAAKAALVALPEELLKEDPLEALLDEQSDEEFGDLVLRDAKRKRSGQTVKLAEWTAQDFSSIYVRFRPHLERHARRFLSNPSQVDEVVQDAFLYLMVSLPELDSEIGVLRFLKWKTRLLALDVIRASGKAYINSIDDVPEPESEDPEVSAHLEQQDDAAVVKLALSKLNPRHREVLIASMYEEKSTEQIAAQVGLSENATRQLIFRARSAFKKALIGDVDTTGMSAAAILSVAARKAAADGKKIGASAMALIALVVMSMSFWPSVNGSRNQDNLATPAETSQPQALATETPEPSGTSSPEPAVSADQIRQEPTAEPAPSFGQDSSASNKRTGRDALLNDSQVLDKIFGAVESNTAIFQSDENYTVFANEGITVMFTFNKGNSGNKFKDLDFSFDVKGDYFYSNPTETSEVSFVDTQGLEHYVVFANLTYLYDTNSKIWTDSPLAKATTRLELVKDPISGEVLAVYLSILPKS
jgi:RNA polymerase sigma factor (sigma-70 family)